MDKDRKREILEAEARQGRLEELARALAARGVYIIGKLTHGASSSEANTPPPHTPSQPRDGLTR